MNLSQTFAQYGDTDKDTIHSYASFYEGLFASYRESARAVLEVGVRGGGSVKGWRDWFPNAVIYGVDNGSEVERWQSDDARIITRFGDSTRPETLVEAIDGNLFDIVIDDGCHHPSVQAVTWGALYPFVRPGGLYVIEDVEGITHAQALKHYFGGEIEDRREVKGRHDDILLVFRKPLTALAA